MHKTGFELTGAQKMDMFVNSNVSFAGMELIHSVVIAQRIESWWGFLRKECVEFWLSLFDQIKAEGNFDGGPLGKNLVLFCFLGMIQDELDLVAEVWDSHVIRPSRNLIVPNGIPNIMFSVPELCDSENYMCRIDEEEF
ncbi:hypothetical protein ACJMK2_043487 [Sinanodonta woodiana]|uniref:Uncharacterized protein n=1 Tax=Sinanodonta woodiana TaxID=1069815 RepID=A0ABD3VX27_SINWO